MMEKKHIRIVLLLALLIVIPGIVESSETLLAQASSSYRRGGSGVNLGEPKNYPKHGFSITPPAQWWVKKDHPRFAVMFSDKSYQAYIMIDAVPVTSKVILGKDFKRFISEKNKQVKESIPSFQVLSKREITINRQPAYRTEATFKAGPNSVLMNIYYVPGKTKVFMITTVCPEAAARTWEPLFNASVSTFTVLE